MDEQLKQEIIALIKEVLTTEFKTQIKKDGACLECGKTFASSHPRQKFCDSLCFNIYRKKQMAEYNTVVPVDEITATIDALNGEEMRKFYKWLNQKGIQDMDYDSMLPRARAQLYREYLQTLLSIPP